MGLDDLIDIRIEVRDQETGALMRVNNKSCDLGGSSIETFLQSVQLCLKKSDARVAARSLEYQMKTERSGGCEYFCRYRVETEISGKPFVRLKLLA